MDWTQVMTILVGNLAMFLWAHRQARSDFFHLDKKIDDHRRESQDIIKSFRDEMTFMIKEIKDQMKDFHERLLKIEMERRG